MQGSAVDEGPGWEREADHHDGVKIRDRRYLFGLRPWAFFSLWFVLGTGVGALLENTPWWVRIAVLAPIGWSMPLYVGLMPVFRRRRRMLSEPNEHASGGQVS
jgi:hypothetical protein